MWLLVFLFLMKQTGGLFEDTYMKHLAMNSFRSEIEKGKTFTLVEFYAPWCPHCQHFDPYLQAVAEAFSKDKEADISLYHIDCKEQRKLCIDYFHVEGYPSVFIGKKDEVLQAFDTKKNVLKKITAEHNTAKLAAAINGVTGASVTVTSVVTPGKSLVPPGLRETVRVEHYLNIQQDDIFKATAYLLKFAEPLVGVSRAHETAIDAFVTEMAKTYPYDQCRHSLSILTFQPRENGEKGYMISPQWKFCDQSWDQLDALQWKGCLGSTKESRGYTCGLWSIFHSMLINGALFSAIRNYIKYFFGCKDCQRHFLAATKGYEMFTTSPAASVMYLWKIHNNVNDRIKNQPDTDPKFPKAQWPMQSLCPSCRRSDHSFNLRKVYRFLNFYYKGDGNGDYCSQIISPRLCLRDRRCRVNERLCVCESRKSTKYSSKTSINVITVKQSKELLPPEMKNSQASQYGSGVFAPHEEMEVSVGSYSQRKLPQSCSQQMEFFEEYLDVESRTYVQHS